MTNLFQTIKNVAKKKRQRCVFAPKFKDYIHGAQQMYKVSRVRKAAFHCI